MSKLTLEMLKQAETYQDFCFKFGRDRFDIVSAEIAEFCQKNSIGRNWCGDSTYRGGFITFSDLSKKLFEKFSLEIDFNQFLNDFFSSHAEYSKVSDTYYLIALDNCYFLDGIYRMFCGENFEEMMSDLRAKLQIEHKRLIPELREKLKKNIDKTNSELEEQINLLRKKAAKIITESKTNFEEYTQEKEPSLTKDIVSVYVSWPEHEKPRSLFYHN